MHCLVCARKWQCCACRAPEQADADFGPRGAHTDVWGFAACVLRMANGEEPYKGLTLLQMVSAFFKKRPPCVPSTVPAWLQQLLTQCFNFDAAARPSITDLLQVKNVYTAHVLHHNLYSAVFVLTSVCKWYKGTGLIVMWSKVPVQLWTILETIAFTLLYNLAKLARISETVLQGFKDHLQQEGSIVGPAVAASQGEGTFKAAALLGQVQVRQMLRRLSRGSTFTPFERLKASLIHVGTRSSPQFRRC